MIEPGGRPSLARRPGQQDALITLISLRGQQQFLDRDHPVEELVVAAPHPAHAALTDWLVEPVAPANDRARERRHVVMIWGTLSAVTNLVPFAIAVVAGVPPRSAACRPCGRPAVARPS